MTIEELRRVHRRFKGNWEHLHRLTAVLATGRKTDERRRALDEWARFNTTRSDSVVVRRGGRLTSVKGRLRITYAQVDLRGASFDGCFLGAIDLSGAKLDRATFRGATLTRARLRGASLQKAKFEGACLKDADLSGATLSGAKFKHAYMPRANLSQADCRGTHFEDADLEDVQLKGADLRGAFLTGCRVFGVVPWEVKIDETTRQDRLVVVGKKGPPTGAQFEHGGESRKYREEPRSSEFQVLANNLQGAHFLYSMFQPDLRAMLGDVISQAVLLLGRFNDPERVLERLAEALRDQGRLPLLFTFATPEERTLKETVLTLAGLCRFVIADVTEAQSVTYELATIVGQYKIPVVPLVRSGRAAFSMFKSLDAEYRDRLLPLLEYDDVDELVARLETDIIRPAERLSKAMRAEKVNPRAARVIRKNRGA